MSDSSSPKRPGPLWSPHFDGPHAAPLTHPGQALTQTQSAVLYKMWSFGPTQQHDTQRQTSLMRANPANRRPLLNLRRKPILFRRRPGSAVANLEVDDEQDKYIAPPTEYRTEKTASTSSSFQSKQDQQNQGNSEGHADDEKRRPLEVGPTRLQLALTKPKTNFAMLALSEDLPKFQNAADVLAYFTQALLNLRDKATRSQTGLKLRPLTQELILCLLSTLEAYGTLPMTKLDVIRQYLIEAVQKYDEDSQGQHQGKEKEEEERQNKKPAASNLPESVKNLNLLMPLIILDSHRPSTSEQLKLACGRIKTLISTALK